VQSFSNTITTTTTTTTTTASSSFQEVRNIHATSASHNNLPPTTTTTTTGPPPHHYHQNYDYQEEEEEMMVAADEVTDPYDPYVPNDLLQYWDRQALAKERAALEKDTRAALESQRLLRLQLEQEREELQRKGDYQKLQQHQQQHQQQNQQGSGRGRGQGRGRGVSNLPAWLVEKQRKEREEGLGSV
jgi:hypothetical protein